MADHVASIIDKTTQTVADTVTGGLRTAGRWMGRHSRKAMMTASLVGASMTYQAQDAQAAPVALEKTTSSLENLSSFVPRKVSNGYIKPYTESNLRAVVRMVQEPSAYDDIFQEVEDTYGIPFGIIKLYCVNESRLKPDAQSPTGPRGICQFTGGTARWSTLTVNKETDERLDPRKSIHAMGLLMSYYLGQTNGKFFSEDQARNVFKYLHGYTDDKAHLQYVANVWAAAKALGLPTQVDKGTYATVKGGSKDPLRFVAPPKNQKKKDKKKKKNKDAGAQEVLAQADQPVPTENITSQDIWSDIKQALHDVVDWDDVTGMMWVVDNASKEEIKTDVQEEAPKEIVAENAELVDTHAQEADAFLSDMVLRQARKDVHGPVTDAVLEERIEKNKKAAPSDNPEGGGPDPKQHKDKRKPAFSDEQRADLVEKLMNKKVRLGNVVFDMTQAYADNGSDVTKPVPHDLEMLLGVYEKAYGADKAVAYLYETMNAPKDKGADFTVDIGASVTSHVNENEEHIAYLLEINKTLFTDKPRPSLYKRLLPEPSAV